jgi:2-polyprenyl-3-methyl-5-hydroxy-6-metoxy-1,4-benzoquinol methylase
MSEFDKVASTWDANKIHVERSQAIASKLLPHLRRNTYKKALEYGAGTGLLSFMLKDQFQEIILMDSSKEMVNTANAKIAEGGEKHMKSVFFDLEKNDYTEKKFDVIISQMVLHHVDDIGILFRRFRMLLNQGGLLAVADLYSEDGSFHGDGFTGHRGFDPESLKSLLIETGFESVEYEPCFTIRKEVEEGIEKEFPVFLLTAKKYKS